MLVLLGRKYEGLNARSVFLYGQVLMCVRFILIALVHVID